MIALRSDAHMRRGPLAGAPSVTLEMACDNHRLAHQPLLEISMTALAATVTPIRFSRPRESSPEGVCRAATR